jgi:predicted DNA-binding ribbon-helix-helix protein
MRHRIVQHAGKRYSLKLDALVWEALEGFAAADGIRLNELVARVGRAADGRSSLTEALRLYSLRRALEGMAALSRRLEDRALTVAGAPVGLIVDACPAPCLLVAGAQTIRRVNAAAERWMGVAANGLIGRSLEHYLQIRSTPPLATYLAAVATGEATALAVRALYLRPGRVVMARATLCPAAIGSGAEFSYLVMIGEGAG